MLAEAEANWDGRPRLDRMAVDTFNCADTPLNRAFVRKTMLAAVTRARIPGCKFDQILVMDSPEGWNKSMAWRVLAGDENFSDESLIGLDARKVQEELAGVWIHENAELAGMAKREIETVKAFASRQEDRARPAYGRFSVNQPRHSIEVGTTNSARYLLSMNGNRRFWPVRVLAAIDIGQLRRDRLQLWGEAAHLQTSGEDLVLDPMLWEVAAAEQEDRRARHPWEAVIEDMTRVVTTGPLAGVGVVGNGIVHTVGDEERVATIDIFRHVLNVPNGQLDIRHSRTLGDIMRLKGWRNGVFALEGKTVRGYVRTKDWG
jgi:predicted P-loop ATPase